MKRRNKQWAVFLDSRLSKILLWILDRTGRPSFKGRPSVQLSSRRVSCFKIAPRRFEITRNFASVKFHLSHEEKISSESIIAKITSDR